MGILIVGAGLSGCVLARILTDNGHAVSVIEKENCVGGLCVTRVHESGIKYEPYGARTFHTDIERVRDFVSRFDEFNGYAHRKGMIINGECFPFPLTLESIERFPEKNQIVYLYVLKDISYPPKPFPVEQSKIFHPLYTIQTL